MIGLIVAISAHASQAQQAARGAVTQQGESPGSVPGGAVAQAPAMNPGGPSRASEGPGPQARPHQASAEDVVAGRAPEAQTIDPFSEKDPCADVGLGTISETARSGARNAARLQAVEQLLAPGFSVGRYMSGRQIIADYQEEVAKRHPDAAVAGAYLGVVSTVQITPQVVAQINRQLCVSTSEQLTKQIAAQAAAVRARAP